MLRDSGRPKATFFAHPARQTSSFSPRRIASRPVGPGGELAMTFETDAQGESSDTRQERRRPAKTSRDHPRYRPGPVYECDRRRRREAVVVKPPVEAAWIRVSRSGMRVQMNRIKPQTVDGWTVFKTFGVLPKDPDRPPFSQALALCSHGQAGIIFNGTFCAGACACEPPTQRVFLRRAELEHAQPKYRINVGLVSAGDAGESKPVVLETHVYNAREGAQRSFEVSSEDEGRAFARARTKRLRELYPECEINRVGLVAL